MFPNAKWVTLQDLRISVYFGIDAQLNVQFICPPMKHIMNLRVAWKFIGVFVVLTVLMSTLLLTAPGATMAAGS